MRYTLDLCGKWELVYSEDFPSADSTLPDFSKPYIIDAVPGYWEDMIPSLQMAPYWDQVKFNPEFRPLSYPMTGNVPDMVLDTIVGCFWYRRNVLIEACDTPKSVFFKCGGVQNHGVLWVNGSFAGEHFGYCTDFSFDITEFIKFGEVNEFIFAVSNHEALNENGDLISGCTSRAANQYTGGVMGDISVELRNPDAISDMYISPYNPESDTFTVYTELCGTAAHSIVWEITDGETLLCTGESNDAEFPIPRGKLELWSPKNPKLYKLKLTLCADGKIADKYEQNIGIRQIITDGYSIKLNGEPIYMRGICEHGYFAKTVHPDPDINYYINIIRTLKQLDFNFIRFHTWIPTEEYMCAADKLGILLHIESPNNTTEAEWVDIMRFVRRHPSVVICCCGNELFIDDTMMEHLEKCANHTHTLAPGLLFSPMSALRSVEYIINEKTCGNNIAMEPFKHNPVRFKKLQSFCDVFSSYALAHHSYCSDTCDIKLVDSLAEVYKLPRLSHEICIHGTYVDLGLECRYDGTRIGETALFSSVRKILTEAGLIKRAPLYYVNSCKWQKLLRKQCFENVRLSETFAGYDFLGDIDHHWHTFGYHVGMMNEFYEMKPTETVENVRRYNGESVILCDLTTDRCYFEGDTLKIGFLASLYGGEALENATLNVRLESLDRTVLSRFTFNVNAENGKLSEIALLETVAPQVKKPSIIRVCARISHGCYELENQWDIHVYPKVTDAITDNIICTDTLDDNIIGKLENGADVLLIGAGPLQANPMYFRISLAGRTEGNLATVIENHPLTDAFEHEGFCDWQFYDMMNGASCLYYSPSTEVPFDPIIEVVSSYKWIRKQAALAEFKVGKGRLLVSTFNLSKGNAASKWWMANLVNYMNGSAFAPRTEITVAQLLTLFSDGTSAAGAANTNLAFNKNDKTMKK